MRALITTSPSGSDAEARELADRFGLTAQPRRDRLVEELFIDSDGAPLLLLGALSADLFVRSIDLQKIGSIDRRLEGSIDLQAQRSIDLKLRRSIDPQSPAHTVTRATLGMALLRFSRALQGELDPLVRIAQLQRGDRVIDATLGLGGDALIAAHATQTKVLALEKSPLLAAFTQAALRRPGGDADLRKAALEAGERIDIRAADHLEFLAAQPDKSAEVVLFDPMFRSPVDSAPVFDVVRAHSDFSALSTEALQHARRVATRGVLIKDSPRGTELRRLQIDPIHSRRFLFGWIGS